MEEGGKSSHVAEDKWKKTVPHAILYGQYELTIDAKNRLLVPADIRRRLEPERDGTAFFIVTGDNGRLWLYPEKIYEAMADGAPQELAAQ